MQEISNNYFIRLGACQGKFLDWVRDAVVLCGFSVGNELFTIFSVGSINFSVYIMGKFAIISSSVIA